MPELTLEQVDRRLYTLGNVGTLTSLHRHQARNRRRRLTRTGQRRLRAGG